MNIVLFHPKDTEPQAFALEIDFEKRYEIWEVPYLSGWLWEGQGSQGSASSRADAVRKALEHHRSCA